MLNQNPSENTPPPNITKVEAFQGVKWLTDSFKLFKGQLKSWLIISGFLFVLLLIPGLNQIVALLIPIPIAGIIIGCSQLSEKSGLVFDHLFCALKTHSKPLLILCGLYALSSLVITLVTYFIMSILGYDIINLQPEKLQDMKPQELLEWMLSNEGLEILRIYLLTVLIYLALLIPVMMAYWFAPALIVLNNLPPVTALKLSYRACITNIIPFSVYGLVGFIYMVLIFTFISIISTIIPILSVPLVILLFLSVFSISLASIYVSYLSIFSRTERQSDSDSYSGMIA